MVAVSSSYLAETPGLLQSEYGGRRAGRDCILIEHWLTIVGCWHNPKRSLRKAQQVCQWMSNGLSLALQGKMDLEELIEDILKPMQKGCRVDARRKKPSTYQYIARRSLSNS
jgi:hypothetical protein